MKSIIGKSFLMYIAMAVVSAIVTLVGGATLSIIMGLLIYAAFVLLMFGEGSSRGEHDCGIRDTIKKLENEGKQPGEQLTSQTYDPKKVFIAALICIAPLVILGVVNLICANPESAEENIIGVISRIVFLPASWITRWCTELVKYNLDGVTKLTGVVLGAIGFDKIDYSAIQNGVKEIDVFAYAYNLKPLTVMRIAFIPAAILPEAALVIGYLTGPKLRAKTVAEMLKGTNKKRKKLKVYGRSRQVKQRGPEI